MPLTTVAAGNVGKPDPFTICIVANPALEAPWNTGVLTPDPIIGNQPAFDAAVRYVCDALFGRLPGQTEQALGDPAIQAQVRVASIYEPGLPSADHNALIGLDPSSTIVIARRDQIKAFVTGYGVEADIVYVVSANASHNRASAWPTDDDIARGGASFDLDGTKLTHCFYNEVPGTIAIHHTETSLTALHEFQHALGSYQNGEITDLYVDSRAAVNCKTGQPPIPPVFRTYRGHMFNSDPLRDSLGYTAGWTSYHCGLYDSSRPAIMDNYWTTAVPNACQNDQITRAFILDRVRAKLSR